MVFDKLIQRFNRFQGIHQAQPAAVPDGPAGSTSRARGGSPSVRKAAEKRGNKEHGHKSGRPVRPRAVAPVSPSASWAPKRHVAPDTNENGPFSGVRIFYFFLFGLLFLALYLSYLLVSPFLHTIILACIFAALSHPLYKKLLPFFRNNGFVASGATLLLLVIVVLLPVVFFIIQLIPQATSSISTLAQWLSSNHLDEVVNDRIYPFLAWLNDEITWVDLDVQDMRASLLAFSRRAGQMLVTWGTGFVVDSLNMAANFLLMLLVMFFLLKDGEGMISTLRHLTPLRAEQKDSIIQNLRRMAKSVLMGGFLVAAIQGFVGGIGLAIVGITPLFWGTVMAFAALVPVLGTALVWVPAVVYLALTGQTKSAIFLLAWCGVLVTSVDSLLRPIIIRGNNKTSLLFLFLAVLGGIKAFGVLGIVYGPLILSFVGVMLAMYSEEYSDSLTSYQSRTTRRVRKQSVEEPPPKRRMPTLRGRKTLAAMKEALSASAKPDAASAEPEAGSASEAATTEEAMTENPDENAPLTDGAESEAESGPESEPEGNTEGNAEGADEPKEPGSGRKNLLLTAEDSTPGSKKYILVRR